MFSLTYQLFQHTAFALFFLYGINGDGTNHNALLSLVTWIWVTFKTIPFQEQTKTKNLY